MLPYYAHFRYNAPKPERYTGNDFSKQKQFKSDVKALNKRTEYLTEIMNNSFSKSHQTNALNKIKEKLKIVLEKIDQEKKNGSDHSSILNACKNKYHEDLKKFKEFEGLNKQSDFYSGYWDDFEKFNKNPDIEDRIERLRSLSMIFGSFQFGEFKSYHSVSHELEQIRKVLVQHHEIQEAQRTINQADESSIERILRKFIIITKNFLPEIGIINELKCSLQADQSKREKFDKLKREWLEFTKNFIQLKSQVTIASIQLQFIHGLEKLEKQLNDLKFYFSCNFKPKDVSLKNLCSLKEVERQKCLEEYGKQVEEFIKKCEEFQNLKKSSEELNKSVCVKTNDGNICSGFIKNIVDEIENVRKQKNANLDFLCWYDSSKLKEQFQTIVSAYAKVEKEMLKKIEEFNKNLRFVESKIDDLKNPRNPQEPPRDFARTSTINFNGV